MTEKPKRHSISRKIGHPLLLGALFCISLCQRPVLASPDSSLRTIDAGYFVFHVSTSQTAQVFHIVDQLSNWSTYCHPQYRRWASSSLELDASDRQLLEQHAALRKKRDWGGGFEQAFYVDGTVEAAADSAIKNGILKPDEANAERDILNHFAPKLDKLIGQGQPGSIAFISHIEEEKPRIETVIKDLARFVGLKKPIIIPVFLMSNPDKRNFGGGFNGGKLVLEVPESQEAALGTFLHESMHAMLETRMDDMKRAADPEFDLDEETINEGIAYALSPGIPTRLSRQRQARG